MKSRPHPCTARSSRTGQPCGGHAIVGGTVCWHHGGAAQQVRAKAQQRQAVAEAARVLDSLPRVDPAQALDDAQAVIRQALVNALGAGPDQQALATALAEQLAKVAKAAADAGVQRRRLALDEAQVAMLGTALELVLTDLGLDPAAPATRAVVHRRLLELEQA